MEDLAAIADEGGPQVTFVGEPGDSGYLPVDLVVDCRDAPNAAGGIRLRPRERVRVFLPPNFPLELPRIMTPHRRWAKTAHVQWGRWPCLYRTPAVEWNPGDGIYGYIDRLLGWLDRASAGRLDAVGAPMHPPVAYPSGSGSITIRVNAPRARDSEWLGMAILRQRSDSRWDLIGWEQLHSDWIDTVAEGRENGDSLIAAAALVLPEPIGFEYPTSGAELFLELRRQSIFSPSIFVAMGLAARLNAALAAPGTQPVFAMIGAPGRGVVGQESVTHVVAWRVEAEAEPLVSAVSKIKNTPDDAEASAASERILDAARDWLIHASLSWTRVHEMRPETTVRRDYTSPAAALQNLRVLVLGAGAIGAPTAEACVRAQAASVTILDNARVHPGILVRQPYCEDDIDEPKAEVLAARLTRIDASVTVTGRHLEVTRFLEDDTLVEQFDLVIDATADRVVRHAIEFSHRTGTPAWPALITMMIGYQATRGIVAVNRAGSPEGAVDLLRRLGQSARAGSDLSDVAADFYPDPPRTDLFQPEPGCSDATFAGSSADVSGLAGQLLVAGLAELAVADVGSAAAIVRMPATGGTTTKVQWRPDLILEDQVSGFQVRVAAVAIAQMRAETRRGLRVRGRDIETGGMLLGQLDAATRVLWIDTATGPPPDSILSASYFEHGTAGVANTREAQRRASARTSDFIGYWHTHPDGQAAPSPTDHHSMTALVEKVPGCGRVLMLILGGVPSRWDAWIEHAEIPATFVQIFRRGEELKLDALGPSAGDFVRSTPRGTIWPGGFGPRISPAEPRRFTSWAALLRWFRR